MKRMSKTGLVLVSLLALTATASAEPSGSGNNDSGQRWAGPRYDEWQSKRELYQKLAKKFHKPKPISIDPGRGDGRVPVEPAPQSPQGPPGFVWVNGHWEREKAPGVPNVPVEPAPQSPQGPPGFIWVNGHWERVKAPGVPSVPHHPTVVVRDHRTVARGTVVVRDHRTVAPGKVIVRDHRTPGTVVIRDHRTVAPSGGWQLRPQDVSSSPGGVTVTDSPRENQNVQVRDHRGTTAR